MAKHTYPLLLKTLLHGHEPLLHKGGRLVPIWKRKLNKQPLRSIQVHPHLLARGKMHPSNLEVCTRRRCMRSTLFDNQIGGQRKAPVTLGVHLTRAYFRHHHLRQQPVALIFLDLSEAFYRVIRPLAVGGCTDDETLALVASRLGLPEAILEDLRQHLTSDHATKEAQLPTHLQRALFALHLDYALAYWATTRRLLHHHGNAPRRCVWRTSSSATFGLGSFKTFSLKRMPMARHLMSFLRIKARSSLAVQLKLEKSPTSSSDPAGWTISVWPWAQITVRRSWERPDARPVSWSTSASAMRCSPI